MENTKPITRVGLDSTLPTRLGLGRIIDANGVCYIFAKVCKNIPAKELSDLRAKLTEAALYFSEAGYMCEYSNSENSSSPGSLKIYEAPEDEANKPPRPQVPEIEPTSKLIGRIFGMFKVTYSPDGCCFLINKGNLSFEEMENYAEQLRKRKFIAKFSGKSNFIQVSLTPELEEITTQLFTVTHNDDESEGNEVVTG